MDPEDYNFNYNWEQLANLETYGHPSWVNDDDDYGMPRSSSPGGLNTPPVGVGTINQQSPIRTGNVSAGVGIATAESPVNVPVGVGTVNSPQSRGSNRSNGNRSRRSNRGNGNGSRRSNRSNGNGSTGSNRSDGSSVSLPRTRRRRRNDDIMDQAAMQQKLVEIMANQQETVAGHRISGITTTNTITTTYKDGECPTVACNSTSVRN